MKKKQTPKAAALRYDRKREQAPRLMAKGQGRVAEKILQVAKENHIPIQKDPALVEVLAKLDILDQIPPECYLVVAEILAVIYKAQQPPAPPTDVQSRRSGPRHRLP